MSSYIFCFLVCLLVSINHSDADPVSFIDKCKSGDTKCLKQSVQAALPTFTKGIPELKVASLDPLHVKNIDASGNGLNLVVTDLSVTGLRSCQVKDIKWDQNPTHLQARLLCNVNLEGQYEMSGSLLILPIEGKGALHAKLRKLVITMDVNIQDKARKDGQVSWDIKSWSHKFELQGEPDLEFENLFKGNKQLGDAARQFVSVSGKAIITEVGPPVVKAVCAKLIKNINHFFNGVPYEDLVDVQ